MNAKNGRTFYKSNGLIKKDMHMDRLKSYKNKRNFSATAEPEGTREIKTAKRLRFVVQRHHASHLHYDFRLELDGVLKSWAVPKGPSMNPKDKRLAVEVEDHPVDYAAFEGNIPMGNYGAGVVTIFDSGYYDLPKDQDLKQFLDSLQKGNITFNLHGHLLKGEFTLIRLKQDGGKNWLLVKINDKYATNEDFSAEDYISAEVKEKGMAFKKKSNGKPTRTNSHPLRKKNNTENGEKQREKTDDDRVMLTKLQKQLPDDGNWVFEKKYDGFRLLALKKNKKIQLLSRNGNIMNEKFPTVVAHLSDVGGQDFELDGEVVVENNKGQSDFQSLQHGEPIADGLHLKYYIFDLLMLDGNDIRNFSLRERRELLDAFLKKYQDQVLTAVDQLPGESHRILTDAEEKKWEGIVAKRLDSRYQSGKRTGDWIKVKFHESIDALICGFTRPRGSRTYFGSVVLGYYHNGQFIYIGNCGTGFSDQTLHELYEQFEKLVTPRRPFPANVSIPREHDITWLKPDLVCEVYYSEWTNDNHLRHPVFKGLRSDKNPRGINLQEIKQVVPAINENNMKINGINIQLSNLDKIYWPEEGYTKGQMLAYYEHFGKLLLPFLHNKPLSLNRFPNGITGKSFFQKDVDLDNIPDWVQTYSVFSDSSERMVDYIVCNNLETLLYVANLGSIEINPWLSCYNKPEFPAFAVLDLDPHEIDFKVVVKIAQTARQILESADVPSYIKTSGSTGLHIYINVDYKYEFEVVKNFVQYIATLVHERFPDQTSIVRSKEKRKGLLYLDFLQNRRGQTIAAPYSLRPRPRATVSAPLFWDEVNTDLSIQEFTLESMPERIKANDDPWKTIWDNAVDIKKALKKF